MDGPDADDHSGWPVPTPPEVFVERRERLARLHPGPLLLAAGFSRTRNFPGNRYPYRAESHFLYLVGAGIEGAVLTLHDGEATLYVSPPDPEETLWTGPQASLDGIAEERGLEVRPLDALEPGDGVATVPPQDGDTAFWLSSLLDREIEAGGGDELTGADAALAGALVELRLRHDDAAVAQLRQAAAITRVAHLAGMRTTRAGVREAAVRGAMEGAILSSGMVTAYAPIVTTHGEILHAETYTNVLGSGDLVLADVGAETPEGWASDVTRTWPVSGRFSDTQRALYDIVLQAQHRAIQAIGPGRRFLDVHRAAGRAMVEGLVAVGILRGDVESLLARGAAALFFPHGIGHLLGLDVHDLEDLGDLAGYAPGRTRSSAPGDRTLRLDRDLEAGMVVTVEPGFYRVPGLLEGLEGSPLADAVDRRVLESYGDVRGIRIEDDVLVTPDGAELLTRDIPKDPEEIEALVGCRSA
jgi:Xaa-Pro aminopeptidase